MTAAPPALSGFTSRSWLASIQADSLKSGRLSRSAMRKVQGASSANFPGIEANATGRSVVAQAPAARWHHRAETALITWRTAVDADEIAEDELSDASR